MRSVSGPFGPLQSIIGSACYFSQVGSVLGQIDPLGTPCGCLKGPKVGQYALLLCIIYVRRVSGPFGPFQSIIGSACYFSQIGSVLGQIDPLGTPCGCLKGPKVGQYAFLLCIIYVRRVSGSFGPFQSIIGSACYFSQVGSVLGQIDPLGPPCG